MPLSHPVLRRESGRRAPEKLRPEAGLLRKAALVTLSARH